MLPRFSYAQNPAKWLGRAWKARSNYLIYAAVNGCTQLLQGQEMEVMVVTIAEFFNKIGFKVNEGDVKKVNNTISDIKSTATKLLGAIGIGFSLANMNAMVEEFDAINDKINYTVKGLGDVKEAQQGILDAANAVKTSYSDMANVVTNLVKASPEMFPVDQAISFSTNLTKLMKSAGRNDSEIASIMEGMNKSFQKGAVDTETLNKMLEQAPETANYLAERMGVARTQLLQMATDGTLSVNDLRDAFVASSKEIDAAFGQLNFGVSDALLNIRNKWGFWLKETDEMLGLTQTIGKVMVRGFDMAMGALNRVRNAVVWLTDKLGGTEKAMRLLGIVVGTVFGLKALGGIASFIKGFKDLDKAALGAKAKMLAIVAVIVLIALLVEDFINFMQGNDSVIGSLLEKAGIDTQKVRDTIISAWNRIKDFLGAAWNAIKDTAKSVWDGLKAFWDEHGEAVMEALAATWETIKTVLVTVWNVISTVAQQLFGALSEWWAENGESVMQSFKKIWEGIKNLVMVVWNAISKAAKAIFGALKQFWDKWGGTITAFFKNVWNTLVSLIQPFLDAIAGIIDFLASVFTGDWEGAWNAIKDIAAAVWDMIVAIFKGAWENIKIVWSVVASWFQGIWDGIVGVFSGVVEWFSGLFSQAWEAIKAVFAGVGEFFQGVWDTIVSLFTSIGTAVGDAISGAVKGAINAVLSGAVGIINGFISAINFAIGVINAIPGVSINKLDKLEVPQLAEGGFVKANQPRLAVIGDNKTQGEIVAPEGKLLSIMTQALGNFVAKNAGGEAQALSMLLNKLDSMVPQNGSEEGKAVSGVLQALDNFVAKMAPERGTAERNAVTQNRSIVQNNVFNNEFNGDTPVQQKASKAMDKSAKDATSEMARALAYSR